MIDGDNLLGTWPGRSRSDAEKRVLVHEIDTLARREKRRTVVVFDGTPPSDVSYGADVLFSGKGLTADAVILDLLRGESDKCVWTVVTNDRSLADQCRFVGAQVEAARTFRGRLGEESSDEKSGPSDGDDPKILC